MKLNQKFKKITQQRVKKRMKNKNDSRKYEDGNENLFFFVSSERAQLIFHKRINKPFLIKMSKIPLTLLNVAILK